MRDILSTKLFATVATLALMVTMITPATSISAASVGCNYSNKIADAQCIMRQLGIPAGPVDGVDGAQTRRGLCIFRYMSSLPITRNKLDTTTYNKLASYDKTYDRLSQIKARSQTSYKERLVAHQKCQAMTYSTKNANGTHYYKKVFAITTGIDRYKTPNGTFPLSGTTPGWQCSTLYPETCRDYDNGKFAYIKNHAGKPAGWGNMYNFRSFKAGGWGIHGSNDIRTSPASHGCIRVSVADSDWMYDHVGNGNRPSLVVIGSY